MLHCLGNNHRRRLSFTPFVFTVPWGDDLRQRQLKFATITANGWPSSARSSVDSLYYFLVILLLYN
jgi:hypothetical protein